VLVRQQQDRTNTDAKDAIRQTAEALFGDAHCRDLLRQAMVQR
jgi:hypothetical protein